MGKQRLNEMLPPQLPIEVATLAESGTFSGSDPLAGAGRVAMAKHVRKFYEHLPGVLSGDDPHDVHQMRVSTRRLRACLTATAPAYDSKIVKGLRKRLKTLAQALGEVRDRDVMLLRLRADVERLDDAERDELRATLDRLQSERDAAHTKLLAELGRKRTMRLLRDLNRFLMLPLDEVSADDDGLPLLVRHHAGSSIWKMYEDVLRYETVMPHTSMDRLHGLRIACKHLRYTLEMFKPALGDDAGSLIKQAEGMQEHLGSLHDIEVALSYFGVDTHALISQTDDGQADNTELNMAIVAEPQNQAVTRYLATRLADRRQLLREVETLWKQISGDAPRKKLTKLIAGI